MSCDFRVRYDQMKDADRVNYSRQLYQKLENLGFSENVKTQIANDMKKLKQNSFELPVRQVNFLPTCDWSSDTDNTAMVPVAVWYQSTLVLGTDNPSNCLFAIIFALFKLSRSTQSADSRSRSDQKWNRAKTQR